uniref:Uncharacterized protein n=1 Tax=Arundo donax TaxID=35708 RepID=A0A0A9CAM1_ARUDO
MLRYLGPLPKQMLGYLPSQLMTRKIRISTKERNHQSKVERTSKHCL